MGCIQSITCKARIRRENIVVYDVCATIDQCPTRIEETSPIVLRYKTPYFKASARKPLIQLDTRQLVLLSTYVLAWRWVHGKLCGQGAHPEQWKPRRLIKINRTPIDNHRMDLYKAAVLFHADMPQVKAGLAATVPITLMTFSVSTGCASNMMCSKSNASVPRAMFLQLLGTY
ncbi:hypothetical protein CB1_002523002 [Camelus ferus]|nr:hypothetical protein CB1_002523002 [Camelus ferus]